MCDTYSFPFEIVKSIWRCFRVHWFIRMTISFVNDWLHFTFEVKNSWKSFDVRWIKYRPIKSAIVNIEHECNRSISDKYSFDNGKLRIYTIQLRKRNLIYKFNFWITSRLHKWLNTKLSNVNFCSSCFLFEYFDICSINEEISLIFWFTNDIENKSNQELSGIYFR